MMGALATIITTISDDVVAALAAASYPPLVPDASGNPGKILVGTAALFEAAAPPRIIFEPIGSKFSARDGGYSNSATLNTLERKHENAMRSIGSEDVQFLVRVWGISPTGNLVDDYDMTRTLYHAVRASIHRLMPGAYEIDETGKWTQGSNLNRAGREFTFGVTFFTPILASLLPYDAAVLYAPPGSVAVITDSMTIPTTGPTTGPTEQGC